MRRHVAPVGEGVDPRLLGRELHQRAKVVDVGVHSAVRHESEQVHALATLERGDERRVLEEGAVLDRAVDPHQVLEENASRTDRQMADLGVTHLSRRKSDRFTGRVQGRVRILVPEAIEVRRARELDRISLSGWGAAPPVEDDERYEGIPARQIAVNDAGSRDAPPTSAPSTAGCASSSAAFSGLTEPP